MRYKLLKSLICNVTTQICYPSRSHSLPKFLLLSNQTKCHHHCKLYHVSNVFKYMNAPSSVSRRHLHCAFNNNSKEHSKVGETVKVLKEVKKTIKEEQESDKKKLPVVLSKLPKRSLVKRVWDELVHYYHGFRLLFIDIRVSSRLAWKILRGGDLTRREHRQLVRTVSDMFRLVPFSVFIIVPFMEFLLPVFLKYFPALLPSTFQSSSDQELKFKNELKMKIDLAKFLQDTLDEMALTSKSYAHSNRAKEFVTFFEKIRTSGEQASNEDIIKFSKLFEDDITLDSLTRPQLTALCRLLELQPFGTNNFLRFQLRMKLRNLKVDDQMIKKEGIDGLTVGELQSACRARGMRALGVPEKRLKSQLQQWLELSLNEHIPPSLLLLSRALYIPENLPAPDQLKATISSLSDTAANEAKYKIGEREGKVDNKTKLELIRREEEEIIKEAEESKQELLEQKRKGEAEKITEISEALAQVSEVLLDHSQKETLHDKAVNIEDQAKKMDKPLTKIKDSEELSKEDFVNLGNALQKISNEKKKLLVEKEEIEELKEEMADYKHDIDELKDMVIETGHKEMHESKAALRLSNKVNNMVSKMDKFLDELTMERKSIQQHIDDKIKEGVSVLKERENVISINELVSAIKRIQKVSDNTRLQRISDVLQKMDVDNDGAVEVDHVLKVIELLGRENIKISGRQIDDIVQLLLKEGTLEHEEKLLKLKQEENNGENVKEKKS